MKLCYVTRSQTVTALGSLVRDELNSLNLSTLFQFELFSWPLLFDFCDFLIDGVKNLDDNSAEKVLR